MSHDDTINARIDGSLTAIGALRGQADRIGDLARSVIDRLRAGGTLYTAGNGGSAAQALHLAEELIGRYRDDRPPLRAVCLNADPAAMTCIANDYGYEQVFARQCEALLGGQDVLGEGLVCILHYGYFRGARVDAVHGLAELVLVAEPPRAELIR